VFEAERELEHDHEGHDHAAHQRNGTSLHLGGTAASAAPLTDKPGRNDPCPCGSGKKYKKCHGA
jgi:uncharacterized protein YecA (UPF0149 family)